ncbi:MAG: hypothetical protein ACE5O2_15605, partial [Armatimonadota bacterium]
SVYDHIESLSEGDVVMLSVNFGPSSMPELDPMAVAIIKHCFERNIKVVGLSLIPVGPPLCERAFNEVAPIYGKQVGEDYVNLGYKSGYTAVMLAMATDIPGTFRSDYSGRKVSTMPMMADIHSYLDVALVIDFASSASPTSWIQIVGARYRQPIAAGVTAVMGTDYYPYLQSGQLVGLLAGLKGAAEYETLTEHEGMGLAGMDAQSIAHCVIIVFVLIGNTAYVFIRRQGRR